MTWQFRSADGKHLWLYCGPELEWDQTPMFDETSEDWKEDKDYYKAREFEKWQNRVKWWKDGLKALAILALAFAVLYRVVAYYPIGQDCDPGDQACVIADYEAAVADILGKD